MASSINLDVQADVSAETSAVGKTQNRGSWTYGWTVRSVFWDQTSYKDTEEWYMTYHGFIEG